MRPVSRLAVPRRCSSSCFIQLRKFSVGVLPAVMAPKQTPFLSRCQMMFDKGRESFGAKGFLYLFCVGTVP